MTHGRRQLSIEENDKAIHRYCFTEGRLEFKGSTRRRRRSGMKRNHLQCKTQYIHLKDPRVGTVLVTRRFRRSDFFRTRTDVTISETDIFQLMRTDG